MSSGVETGSLQGAKYMYFNNQPKKEKKLSFTSSTRGIGYQVDISLAKTHGLVAIGVLIDSNTPKSLPFLSSIPNISYNITNNLAIYHASSTFC